MSRVAGRGNALLVEGAAYEEHEQAERGGQREEVVAAVDVWPRLQLDHQEHCRRYCSEEELHDSSSLDHHKIPHKHKAAPHLGELPPVFETAVKSLVDAERAEKMGAGGE